ncbi:ComF family protein [Aerococcaceae bacterium 50-4]
MASLFKEFEAASSDVLSQLSACLICQNAIDNQLTLADILAFRPIQPKLFCQACLIGLQAIDMKDSCQQCGRPLSGKIPVEVDMKGFCSDCQSWHTYHNWYFTNLAFYQYNTVFKDWLVVLKGQGDIRGRFLFANQLKDHYRRNADAIWVPMPTSNEKLANRGFNQTNLLLEAAGIPYLDILKSEGGKGKQAYKNRQDRLRDSGKITLAVAHENLDKSRSIILFDDVYTTGTTMFSAYKSLDEAGFKNIRGLTLAR